MTLDDLIDFDLEQNKIQEIIEKTNESVEEKIDWTKAWGQKYPILLIYQNIVDIPYYAQRLCAMLDKLQQDYGWTEQDAMLVLKDILAQAWKNRQKSST